MLILDASSEGGQEPYCGGHGAGDLRGSIWQESRHFCVLIDSESGIWRASGWASTTLTVFNLAFPFLGKGVQDGRTLARQRVT